MSTGFVMVGLAAFSDSFLGSSWFRQSGVISSHHQYPEGA
jgi:hypothetical protein